MLPAEMTPTVAKTELQQTLRREFFKRPWIVRCMVMGMGGLIGTLILNSILVGWVSVSARFFILSAVSLVGAVAGAAGFLIAPRLIRTKLPLLWGPMLVNVIFFLGFGWRALELVFHGGT